MVHCGTLCRAIPGGNRRADDIRPYALKDFELSAKYAPRPMSEVRRGGYQPPGCFPIGETTSAHCADNAQSNICKRNSAVQCRNMVYFATSEPQFGQYDSALKFATLAGGYYPLYYGVIAPGDHWILIRCGLPTLRGLCHRITAVKFRCANEVLRDLLY